MKKADLRYRAYVQILKEELVPAMGCTEPIALAYAAAVARKTLGVLPDKVEVGSQRKYYQKCKICDRAAYRTSGKAFLRQRAAGIVAGMRKRNWK